MAMCTRCAWALLLLGAPILAAGTQLRTSNVDLEVPPQAVAGSEWVVAQFKKMAAAGAAQLIPSSAQMTPPAAVPSASIPQLMQPPQVPYGLVAANAGTAQTPAPAASTTVSMSTTAPPSLAAQTAAAHGFPLPGMPTDPPGGLVQPTSASDPAFSLWVAGMESKLHNGLAAEIKFLNTLMRQQSMSHAQLLKFKSIMTDMSVKYQASQKTAIAEQQKVKVLELKMGELNKQVTDLQKLFSLFKTEYSKKWATTEDSLGKLWSQTSQAMAAMSTVNAEAQTQLDALTAATTVAPVASDAATTAAPVMVDAAPTAAPPTDFPGAPLPPPPPAGIVAFSASKNPSAPPPPQEPSKPKESSKEPSKPKKGFKITSGFKLASHAVDAGAPDNSQKIVDGIKWSPSRGVHKDPRTLVEAGKKKFQASAADAVDF